MEHQSIQSGVIKMEPQSQNNTSTGYSQTLNPNICSLPLQRIRALFSVEQYKKFYEDMVCGYIEFLKAEGATRSQILKAHEIKRIKLATVAKLKVSKPYRPYRDYFRTLDLRGIYTAISHPQMFYLMDLVLSHYCESLSAAIGQEITNTAKDKYRKFMGVDEYRYDEQPERRPIGRPRTANYY